MKQQPALLPEKNFQKQIESNIKKRLRQERYIFLTNLIITILFACISLIGEELLLTGQVNEGTFIVLKGMIVSIQAAKLAKDSNDRLNKILLELNEQKLK